MKGHIKLGAVGSTLRSYKLVNERSYRRVTANPYSAKISTGGGTYDDLEPFAYFLQTDWQSGIGHRNPEEGLLSSTAETRVPNQIILPQMVTQSDSRNDDDSATDCRNIGKRAATGTLTTTPSGQGNYSLIVVKLTFAGSLPSDFAFSIYGRALTENALVYSVSRGTDPNSTPDTVASGTLSAVGAGQEYRWYTSNSNFSWSGGSGSTYWLYIGGLSTGDGFEWVCTNSYTDAVTYVLPVGSGTYQTVSTYPIFTTNLYGLSPSSAVNTIVRFNSTLYAGIGTQLYKYTAATDTWAAVGSARAGTIWDLKVWDSTLHIGIGTGNYDTLSTSDVYTTAGVTATHFMKYGGYLWRRWGNSIYYSADGSTWSSAITIPDSSAGWTGMAGMGDVVYVATTEGLYYIAPGDVLVGVTRWGSVRSTNGTRLSHHQGSLYCILDGGVAQISVSGGSASILPIWVERDDDLVAAYLEQPTWLTSTNNWLVATVQQSSSPTKSSLWAWTGQGWHFLAEVPLYKGDFAYYDVTTSSLWVGSQAGVFFKIRVPDYTLNPANDSSSTYMPSAWFETGWITGGLKDVVKDWESVYINGDYLGASQYVDIYYKSSRSGAWTYLGTVDDYGEEARWSTYASRPAVKELKLGFRLFSKSLTVTPDIDVIRLKFLPNVNDRWQWTLPIEVGPGQEMIDGTLNTYTVAQMRSHLEALVQSTPPFLLEDIDGTQYEVVCTGASVDVARLDHYNNEIVPWYIYTMTLEQVRGAAYA